MSDIKNETIMNDVKKMDEETKLNLNDVKNIKFTVQEIFVNRQMIEVALKTIGREAVPAFITLDKKLEDATKQ